MSHIHTVRHEYRKNKDTYAYCTNSTVKKINYNCIWIVCTIRSPMIPRKSEYSSTFSDQLLVAKVNSNTSLYKILSRCLHILPQSLQNAKVHLTKHFHLHAIVFCPCAFAHACYNQRHICTTVWDRPPSTTGCWAMGTKKLKQYKVRKNILYWAGWAKISCTGTTNLTKQPSKDPVLFLYSLSHHLPESQQPAGATPL